MCFVLATIALILGITKPETFHTVFASVFFYIMTLVFILGSNIMSDKGIKRTVDKIFNKNPNMNLTAKYIFNEDRFLSVHGENNTINYEYSDIRAWLNNDFINTAFNTEEQNIINESLVDNSALTTSSNTNKYACNNTNDKVYLLSYKDVTEKYFTYGSEMQAKVTDYGEDKGVGNLYGYGDFWLRSPNCYDSNKVDYVFRNSRMEFTSCYRSNGARPALEIKIK